MSYRDVSPDTLRVDLEALYASVDRGWDCLGILNRRTHGDPDHGCVYQQMSRVTLANMGKRPIDVLAPAHFTELNDRRDAMVAALGFLTHVGLLNKNGLFHWNDYEASWDSMRERIKDAIGRL